MCTIFVRDVFDELTETNRRLSAELIFTNKCLKAFMTYKSFIDFISNKFIDNLDTNEENVFYRLSQNVEQILAEKTGKSGNVTFVTVGTVDDRPNGSEWESKTTDTENRVTKSVVIKQLGTNADNNVADRRPEVREQTQSKETPMHRRVTIKRTYSRMSKANQLVDNSRVEAESPLHKSKVTYSARRLNLIPQPEKNSTQYCSPIPKPQQLIGQKSDLISNNNRNVNNRKVEQLVVRAEPKVLEIKSANQMRQLEPDSEPDPEPELDPNSCSDIIVIQESNYEPIDTSFKPKMTKTWCQSCKKFIATNLFSKHVPCLPYKWNLNALQIPIQSTDNSLKADGNVEEADDFLPADNYPVNSFVVQNSSVEMVFGSDYTRRTPLTISVNDLIDCPKEDCNERLGTHSFIRHMIYVHQELYSFECGEKNCRKCFEIFSDFEDHYRTHNPDPKSKLVVRPKPLNYKCTHEGCPKVFKTLKTCREHKEIHSSAIYSCKWSGCEFTCKQRTVMDAHQTDHHTSEARPIEDPEELIVCPKHNCTHECQRKSLFEHLIRKHGTAILSQYECTISGCNQKFFSRYDHKQHFMIHNRSDRAKDNYKVTNLCTYSGCNRNFDRYDHFRRHVLNHNMSQFFYCCRIGCDFKTKRRKLFIAHERNHNDPVVCDWPGCGRHFKERKSLIEHIRTHTNDKCNKCLWPGCQFRTTRSSALSNHMRTHTTVRDLKCEWPECGKTYKHRINYVDHMRTHTNDRRFSCNMCQYSSTSSSTLSKHKKTCAKRVAINYI